MRTLALLICSLTLVIGAVGQKARTAPDAPAIDYSGMYTFLTEGEFVQLNVEEDGTKISGYVSRYGSHDSDKGQFLDHFFKTASLKDGRIQWTTEQLHGVWFEFKGTIGRGSGKNQDSEGYYVMRGTLVEHSTDVSGKDAARQREVVFKSFPQGLDDSGVKD